MFSGFYEPQENWSKLPNSIIEALPLIETIGEMKVIVYILRHTWGFHDQEKKITLDEFANGRKRKDGSRFDTGTGLTIPTIRDGLDRAEKHGFICVETDDRDKARVKKYYSLRMTQTEKDLHPDYKSFSVCVQDSFNRSEKETLDTNNRENITADSSPESQPSELDAYFGPKRQTDIALPRKIDLRDQGDKLAYALELREKRNARANGEPWLTQYEWITKPRSGIERDTLRHVAHTLVTAGIPEPESDAVKAKWRSALESVYIESGGDFELIKRAGVAMVAGGLQFWPTHKWVDQVIALKAEKAQGKTSTFRARSVYDDDGDDREIATPQY